MRSLALIACLASASATTNSSCGGAQPSTVPDCDRPDMGSCGNACCVVDITIEKTSAAAVYKLAKRMLEIGPGGFTYSNKPDTAGHNPGDDLTPYGIPWQYIFQGTHTTAGGYIDTVDFNVKADKTDASTVTLRVGSVSGVHGSLGDNGQNYKTIAFFAKNTFSGSGLTYTMQSQWGCGK